MGSFSRKSMPLNLHEALENYAYPPLPQPFLTSKKTVGHRLKEGAGVWDTKYLLPQRKLASLAPQEKAVTSPFVLGWFFLETNHESIRSPQQWMWWLQVWSKATLWSPNSSPGHLWGPSQGLGPEERTSVSPCLTFEDFIYSPWTLLLSCYQSGSYETRTLSPA